MRILLTSYFALPNPGGLWTYVHELGSGLERIGHDVDYMFHAPDAGNYFLPSKSLVFEKCKVRKAIKETVLRTFEEMNAAVHDEILDIEIERYTLEMAYLYFGLHGYDVIHTQDIISTRAAARVKPVKTPLVATIHGNLTAESACRGELRADDFYLHEYLAKHEQVSLLSSDVAIMPSQWLKNLYAREYNVPEKHMHVIANGMDTETFINKMNLPLYVTRPYGKTIIACNARLDQVKGHAYLFEALVKLKDDDNDWVCWLIGDGGLRKEYQQRCQQLGLDEYVRFLGNRDDVPALLRAADLCVLPSVQENCPFAVMEAQVAGKPIVASDVGGIPEMIQHETTGLLTPPGDATCLYLTLRRALSEEKLRRKLGKQARKWGREQWSIEKMCDLTCQVYEQVVQRKKSAK